LCIINEEYVVRAHEETPYWKRELQPIKMMIDSSQSGSGRLPVLDWSERRNLGASLVRLLSEQRRSLGRSIGKRPKGLTPVLLQFTLRLDGLKLLSALTLDHKHLGDGVPEGPYSRDWQVPFSVRGGGLSLLLCKGRGVLSLCKGPGGLSRYEGWSGSGGGGGDDGGDDHDCGGCWWRRREARFGRPVGWP
jgi:hypothetical protein